MIIAHNVMHYIIYYIQKIFQIEKLLNYDCADHKSFEKKLKLPLESCPNGGPIILTKEE